MSLDTRSRLHISKLSSLLTTSALHSRSGAGLGEYALIAALIAVLGLGAVAATGTSVRDIFADVGTATQNAGTQTPGNSSPPPAPTDPAPVPGANFAVTLGEATGTNSFPQANVGNIWSFSFANLASLTDPGDVTVGDLTWSGGTPALPSWMTLDASTGVASGTPDVQGSTSFEIVGSYAGIDGQRVYTLDVGGVIIQVTQISAGSAHTCAVTTAGGAKCWGWGVNGQLGNNSASNSLVPVDVSTLTSGVASISAGEAHTCAVTTTGGAKCWGFGGNGRLGNNSTSDSLVPVDVSTLTSGVASISAGSQHTCAVTTTGGAKCWGGGLNGRLGHNSLSGSLVPADVFGLTTGVASIFAGDIHTCAVTTAGGAKCWGGGQWGRLGNNSTTNSLVPVDVSTLTSGVVSISMGNNHTCALTTAGGVKCWGAGSVGQLGNNSTSGSLVPVDVFGLTTGVASISSGSSHTCAVTTTGGAKCWGWGDDGQLGNDSMSNSLVPVDVSTLTSGVASISAGVWHTCAFTTTGVVKCWGSGGSGQLGNNSTLHSLVPVDVLF